MKDGERSQKRTLSYTYLLVFGLTSILPILLFTYVLLENGLISEPRVAVILGLSFAIAGLGYLFSMRIVKQINNLVEELSSVEQGEPRLLTASDAVSEFAEMARIADAFNHTLAELKSHSRELETLVEKLSTLSELTELVSRIPNISEVIETVLHRTMAAVNAQIGSIMLLDDESETLRIAAAEGLDESVVTDTIKRVGEAIAGKVVETGEAVLVEDIEQDSRFRRANDPKYGSSSFVSMPLRAHWRVMGVLNLAKRVGGDIFGESDLKFLKTLLGHIGFALENARLLKEAKDATERLQHVVGDQSAQLDEVKQEALQSLKLLHEAQKMESIGSLACGIAHDFNNIIASIIAHAEVAGQGLPEGTDAGENLSGILEAGHRARDLVRQILAFSRQSEETRQPSEPGPILREALRLLRATLPDTIDIRQNIASDLGSILADPTQIHQVLLNLCTNAQHAMREEGGVLEVSAENVELDSGFTDQHTDMEPGVYLRLTIADTGHGMTPETMERVFDPYFSTKDRDVGTGLGLSVVQGIVKSHGGGVDLESEPGKGTTFYVYFPVIEGQTRPETDGADPLPPGGERILLIADEESVVTMGKEMLEHLGYDVTTGTSNLDALALFREQPDQFDLVITDMTMPEMSGDELAAGLIEIRRDIPIILCTSDSDPISEDTATAMGIRALLTKPLAIRELSNAIRSILDGGTALASESTPTDPSTDAG